MRRLILVLVVVGVAGCGGRKASELADKNKGFAENLKKAIQAKNKAEVARIAQNIDDQKEKLKRFTDNEYASLKAVFDAANAEDWKDAERLVDRCLGDQTRKGAKPGGI